MTPFRMLLIDDDPAMVRLLQRVISRSFPEQISLTALTDPSKAVAWIDENLPDLVVTDLEMPAINGLAILQRVRRRNACAQVIVLTGHSSTTALLEAAENGAVDYLLKPADQEELIHLLHQACERIGRWKEALLGTWRTTLAQS